MPNKPFASIVQANPKDWINVAQKIAANIRLWIHDKTYYSNKPYKTHEAFFFKRKGKTIYAEDYPTRKSKRKAAPRQSSTSTIPDGTLTGKMLQGIRARALADGHGALLQWTGLEV